MARTASTRPPRPPQGATIKVVSFTQIINNYLKVILEISVFRGSTPLSNIEIQVKDGVLTIPAQTTPVTTVNGVALYEILLPLSSKEVVKNLRVCLVGIPEEASSQITVPAKETIKDPAETAFARLYVASNGRITFTCYVIDTDGGPVANKVITVVFKGVKYKTKTDKEGIAIFPSPGSSYCNTISLSPGDEENVFVYVPGIRQNKTLVAIMKRPLIQARAFTRKWWLGVNNGRAFILFFASLLFLITSLAIGVKPLINDGIFANEDGYTQAQLDYNDMMVRNGYPEKVIPPIVDKKDMTTGAPLWVIASFMLIASMVYGAFAAREEIADAIDDLKIKIVERNFAKTNDPLFERLMATVISAGIITNKAKNPVGSTTPSAGAAGEGGIKSMLTSNLLSYVSLDLATDFVRGLIKRVFK